MFRKVFAILSLWMVVVLYESCCDYLPYYTFESIQVETVLNAQTISPQDSLMLRISPQNITYLAQFNSIISGAFAWECSQGDLGLKYAIEDIKIMTLQDFDDAHLAGDLLNDVFQIRQYNTSTDRYEEIALSDLADANQLFLEIIWTKARPASNSPIQVRVEITDMRGNTYLSSPLTITWI